MMIKKLLLLPIAFILFIAAAYADDDSVEPDAGPDDKTHVVSAIGQKIADAYGFQSFDKVSEIQYTFNARLGDKTIKRSWVWNPKDNKVTYKENGETVTYNQNDLSSASEEIKDIDAKFINDQYWLIFPFHLVWDDGIRIEVEDQKLDLPLGSGSSTKISVIYPETGGYTPGDIYDLYLDDNSMITKWVYRKGGSDAPTRVSTWEDNMELGSITISLNRQDPDSDFRVWFTDVIVVSD
ncbi:MAG: hypothetical protein AAF462_06645 [Thermodesulfobacteriota bacterium]